MSELFFATKKKESFPRGQAPEANLVKMLEDKTAAAVAIAEGWRVYQVQSTEVFSPDIQFQVTDPSKAVPQLDQKA